MAKPPTDRAADPQLAERIKALFECVTTEKRFGEAAAGGLRIKKRWANVAEFFGVRSYDFSNWETGHHRLKKEGDTNARLWEIVKGEGAHRAANPEMAKEIHRFWVDKAGQPALDKIAGDLNDHAAELVAIESEEVLEALVTTVRAMDVPTYSDANPRVEAPAREPETGASVHRQGNSSAWTMRQVPRWADRLLNRDERAIYICGAPNAGKSRLITALRQVLEATQPRPHVLLLELGEFVKDFAVRSDQRGVCQMVVDRVREQLRPGDVDYAVPQKPDFKKELGKALTCPGDEPIFLIIANCDHALRQRDPDARTAGIRATSQLYASLKTIVESNAERPFSRVSLVLEGSRPVGDLVDAYGPDDASPFNNARLWDLPRLTADDCLELAEAAGFAAESTRRLLFEATAGHRSLFWSLLRELNPELPIPQDLTELPGLARNVAAMWRDLLLQRGLAEAFNKVLSQERISIEDRTRLRLMMLVDNEDPPRCACPLIEAMAPLELNPKAVS